MNVEASCIISVKSKIIVVGDKGTGVKQQLLNHEQIVFEKIQIECLKLTGEQCDWLLRHDGYELFVELKRGSDVVKATKQICATAKILRRYSSDKQTFGLVVHSGNPLDSTMMQRLKSSFRTNHKITLKSVKRGQTHLLS